MFGHVNLSRTEKAKHSLFSWVHLWVKMLHMWLAVLCWLSESTNNDEKTLTFGQQNWIQSGIMTVMCHPSCKIADAGPGMEVPGDSTSQGRDSVNVSGHAIPAVLCGNQYAVLFDTEPTELEDLDGY